MRTALLTLLVIFSLQGWAQKAQLITWSDLTDVSFEEKFYERYDTKYFYPTFGEGVKKLEGKYVEISGYVIAVEKETGFYVLSANPYAACFFCGNAGPETVIKLNFKDWPDEYETDSYKTFKGELRLSADNIFELDYSLENAEEK